MYPRKIFKSLNQHLSKKLITVISGMRRVGKTTAVKYLLDQIEHDNKVFIDLERIEDRHVFNQSSYKEIQTELEIQGIDFSKPAVIALDEIQLVSDITSVIKYFYDHFEIKFIVTGSSSFYLKGRFSESLAGRKRIFEIYPLDFQEYLEFKGEGTDLIQKFAFQNFQSGIYLKYKDLYQDYLRFGGFPEVVLSETEEEKISYLKDVINAYIELDIRLLSDLKASDDLYNLIRLIAGRTGSPIDYSKLSTILGINRHKLKTYIQLLEKTYFVHTISPYARHIDREISKRKKVYLADTGLVNQLAKVSSGQLFENAIATQLIKLGQLNYYQRKSGAEIDFILNEKIAFEVKETPTKSDLYTLEQRALLAGINEKKLIGRYPPKNEFKEFVWAGQIV